MEIKDVLSILYKRFTLIIIMSMLCTASAALYTAWFTPPAYTATATLIVNKPGTTESSLGTDYTYNDLLLTQKLVKTYTVIITSKSVLKEAIAGLNLQLSVSELRERLTVEGVNDTEIIEIRVTDEIARRAMDIANEIARICPQEIIRTVKAGSVELIDEAELPSEASGPDILKISILAGALGFTLTLGVLLAVEYFDQTVKRNEDVTNLLQLPLMGQLPVMETLHRRAKGAQEAEGILDECDFLAVEAFKALRTNVEFSILGEKKVIMVSSALPGEGKTTISVNLARLLTYTGHNVLLIDCDLRQPRLHKIFNITSYIGLSNLILKKYTLEMAIKNVQKNLDLLCCGPIPPNPVEMLGSVEMKEIIREVSGQYDYVLLDAPPASQMADAVVLSSMATGVLLAVRYGKTPIEAVRNSLDNLTKASARILGAVITQIPVKEIRSYNYHRYSYQQNAARNEEQEKDKHKQKNPRRKYANV